MTARSTQARTVAMAMGFVLSLIARPVHAADFSVTNTSNSGPGSLRQAILDSNAMPGPNVIEIDLPSDGPQVIKPEGQFLPPLVGPVVVRVAGLVSNGTQLDPRVAGDLDTAASLRFRLERELVPRVVLDGSSLVAPRTPSACPGATFTYNRQSNEWESSRVSGAGANVRGYYGAGLAVHDSQNVEISGLEIRNFCAGIAVVRSHDVNIHNVLIADNHGAAGVIFTGDDGNAGTTTLSFNNRLAFSLLVDNGDGFEFTRGTHDSTIVSTLIELTQPLPENGNAIEFAMAGDNNSVLGNVFTKYVETAVALNGAHKVSLLGNTFVANEGAALTGAGAGVLIQHNTFQDNGGDAIVVNGAGSVVRANVVRHNGGRGVVVGAASVTVTQNVMSGNAHLGIALMRPSPAAGSGTAPAAAVVLPSAPTVSPRPTWTGTDVKVAGTLMGKPSTVYLVEVFLSRGEDRHQGDEHGWGEGELVVGAVAVVTDLRGHGTFSLARNTEGIVNDDETGLFATATITDDAGSTSVFSRAVPVTRSAR